MLWLPGPAAVAALLARRRTPAPSTTLTALRHWVPDIAERDVYVCGPRPGPTASAARLAPPACPPTSIHVESFGW